MNEPNQRSPLDSLWPRFSLRGLLIGMAVIAALIPLGGFVLRNASNWIGSLAFLTGGILLAATACMAFNRNGVKRAFWTGCAVFGITYFVIAGDPWSQPYTYELITTTVSEMAYQKYYSEELSQPAATTEEPSSDVSKPLGELPTEAALVTVERPNERDFVMVSHLFWTLLVGFCGGWISLLMYWTGLPKSVADS